MREPNEQEEKDFRILLKALIFSAVGARHIAVTDSAFSGVHLHGILPRRVVTDFSSVTRIVVGRKLFEIDPSATHSKKGKLSLAARSRYGWLLARFDRWRFCIGVTWVDVEIRGRNNWRRLVLTLHDERADGTRVRRDAPPL